MKTTTFIQVLILMFLEFMILIIVLQGDHLMGKKDKNDVPTQASASVSVTPSYSPAEIYGK